MPLCKSYLYSFKYIQYFNFLFLFTIQINFSYNLEAFNKIRSIFRV